MNRSEIDILDHAIDSLIKLTGLSFFYKSNPNSSLDTFLIIKTENKKHSFQVEIKKQISKEYSYQILLNKDLYKERLLVAYYIPKPVKAILKDMAINYIEATGNCFIETADLFIYINDQKSSTFRDKTEGKVWNAAGLKFVFAILNDPELINEPYREIASRADIALGTVGKFIQELKQEGYIKEGKRDKVTFYFLERKLELIEKWSVLYNTVLKPKYTQGQFKTLAGSPAQLPVGNDTLWSGEPAGEKLTSFLVPEKYIIYTWKTKNELMKELRLVPDSQGPVELIQAFWNKEPVPSKDNLVSTILVYADLLGSSDSRNHETALRIKKQYFEQ